MAKLKSLPLYALIVFIFYFLIQAVIFNYQIKYYYPTDDDFPVLANSRVESGTAALKWITSGYSEYFIVFPEWTEPYSNFFRPVANLFFYANWRLFGEDYGKYTFLSYGIHALGVSIVFYLSYFFLSQNFLISFLASLIMFLSPASGFYGDPSFSLDAMAAVWVGFGFILLFKRYWLASTIILILGLFSKETVIYAPVAAGVVFLLMNYQANKKLDIPVVVKSFLIVFIPLGLWIGCRIFLFQGIGEIYALENHQSIKEIEVAIGKAFLVWPLGLLNPYNIRSMVMALLHLKLNHMPWFALIVTAFNMLIWIVILVYLVTNGKVLFKGLTEAFIKRGINEEELNSGEERYFFMILFCLGCLFVLFFLNLQVRFAYSFYMFLIPLLLACLNLSKNKCFRCGLISLLILYSFAGVQEIYQKTKKESRDAYIYRKDLARSLVSMIKSVNKPRIYLVNDVVGSVGSSGAGGIGKFAGSNSDVIIVNQLWQTDSRSINDLNVSVLKISTEESGYRIHEKLPTNNSFNFSGATAKKINENIISNLWIKRGNRMLYNFPELKVGRYRLARHIPIYDFGHEMTVGILDSPEKSAIIFFDITSKTYRLFLPNSQNIK